MHHFKGLDGVRHPKADAAGIEGNLVEIRTDELLFMHKLHVGEHIRCKNQK